MKYEILSDYDERPYTVLTKVKNQNETGKHILDLNTQDIEKLHHLQNTMDELFNKAHNAQEEYEKFIATLKTTT